MKSSLYHFFYPLIQELIKSLPQSEKLSNHCIRAKPSNKVNRFSSLTVSVTKGIALKFRMCNWGGVKIGHLEDILRTSWGRMKRIAYISWGGTKEIP